jgi:hypothetical protein
MKIKKILLIAVTAFASVQWAIAGCPTSQTKFRVYTGLPAPPIVETAASQGTWQRYASLNKKIIAEKSFVMIDLDDIVIPIPVETIKPMRLSYLMEWNHTYEIPYEVDYGNGNVVTQWQAVTGIYPQSSLALANSLPEGTLADYKTTLLNIDIVGQGCPSVLFTSNTLIAESLPTHTAYFGNFILGFNSSGQATRMIELDARFGTALGLGNSDATVELADIDGDGKPDLVIRRNGIVAYTFQGYGSGVYQNFQIDPFTRKSQDILALRQVWKEFLQLASTSDSRATLYFSSYFLNKYNAQINSASFLPLFSEGLIDSDVVKISAGAATYGVVYASPTGNTLDLIEFVRENGAWKINDF